jgi:hypothetical protein
MTTKNAKALTSGSYADLSDGFDLSAAKALWLKDEITEEVLDKYLDHLASGKRPNHSAGMRFKVGEKKWVSLSGGYLGVAFQSPVVLKANTLLALLTYHREEILENLVEALEGEYDIETRESKKGSYNVLIKGSVVVGSANSNDQIAKQKGIVEHCLAMVS